MKEKWTDRQTDRQTDGQLYKEKNAHRNRAVYTNNPVGQ